MRFLPGLAAAALATFAIGGCAGGGAVEPLPPPPSTSALASTTMPAEYRGVTLPAVETGRTTTTAVAMGPGRAKLTGRLVDPEGAGVANATVRLERMVGTATATIDIGTTPDGSWSLTGVMGGGFRIRAWRAPDLAVVNPAFVFVGAADTVPVELKLERHVGTTPIPAVAPRRPLVGQPASLVVQVSSRSVDASGVVQGVPMVGAKMELGAGGGWSVGQPNPTTTDAGGRARWEIVCGATGVQPLRLVVNGIEQFQLALPACDEPPPPTTTVPGSTVAPGPTTTARPGVTTTRPVVTTTTTRPVVTTTTTGPVVTTTTTRPATTTTRPRTP